MFHHADMDTVIATLAKTYTRGVRAGAAPNSADARENARIEQLESIYAAINVDLNGDCPRAEIVRVLNERSLWVCGGRMTSWLE